MEFKIGQNVNVVQYAGLSRYEFKGEILSILPRHPETLFEIKADSGWVGYVRHIELVDCN